ncbi:MAG: sigma-54 factor interaction domain-containing protein [Proteobacteria bacterium]|nr:sigma-54 factor interaction domain-containing protein [Pseudomonadota bacterium]MCP4917119.1 sigma-54 factor interaction domain-containing protein [Pseudomonadota bacterium]
MALKRTSAWASQYIGFGAAFHSVSVSPGPNACQASGSNEPRAPISQRSPPYGTELNGLPIQERELATGDVLRLGDTFLLVRQVPADLRPTRARGPLRGLVGEAPAVHRLRRELTLVAPRRTIVMLLGESGTGKNVAAKALHDLSGRKGPLVVVNCAAIPAQLAESTLFGQLDSLVQASLDTGHLGQIAEGVCELRLETSLGEPLDRALETAPCCAQIAAQVVDRAEVAHDDGLGADAPQRAVVRDSALHRQLGGIQVAQVHLEHAQVAAAQRGALPVPDVDTGPDTGFVVGSCIAEAPKVPEQVGAITKDVRRLPSVMAHRERLAELGLGLGEPFELEERLVQESVCSSGASGEPRHADQQACWIAARSSIRCSDCGSSSSSSQRRWGSRWRAAAGWWCRLFGSPRRRRTPRPGAAARLG